MRTILKNASILRPFAKNLVRSSILIEGNKIAEVRPAGYEPPHGADDRVLDLDGLTVMPGMTTAHWHGEYTYLSLNDLSTVYIGQHKPPSYQAAVAAAHLRNAVASGFTSVAGAGCSFDIDVALKLAIKDGAIDGPRIRAAGRHINSSGSDNDRAKWWLNLKPAYEAGVSMVGSEIFADGEDALRRAVRNEIQRGVEIIKIFPTDGHGITPNPNYRGYTNVELRTICETAHDRGAVVRAHTVGSEAIRECIEAGVDIIDHGDGLDDACIEAMVKAGTMLVPSIMFLKTLIDMPKGSLPDAMLEPVKADYNAMIRIIPRAHQAGIVIVPGDDYGVNFIPHILGMYARDMKLYVEEGGLAPTDVLGWATGNGARLMNQPDLGDIAAGKTADLLVVVGNPLEDVTILADPATSLRAVMIDGRFHKDELAIYEQREGAARDQVRRQGAA